MVRFKNPIGMLLAALFLGAVAGCGGGTGVGGTFGSAESLTFEGWDAYQRVGYDQAEQLFQNALGLDPNFAGAHNGLGWVNFNRAGQEEDADKRRQLLSRAESNFKQATDKNPNDADAWVGLAGVELTLGNWAAARDAANAALQEKPRYFSSHDNIDFQDVRLILAEAFFFLGEFNGPSDNNSLAQLVMLDPDFEEAYKEPSDIIRKIGELQGL
jgi:tetratricopeptide (TPR) repeat protein